MEPINIRPDRDKLIERMEQTEATLKQLLPVVEKIGAIIDKVGEMEQARLQLEFVKIRRDLILREFQSIDNVVNNIFNERSKMLSIGNSYISKGLKKDDPKYIDTGLQIIKLVMMTNPIDTILDQKKSLQEKFKLVESYLE